MSPSLLEPFDPAYFEYSMHIEDLIIPQTCQVYLPDNEDEGSCRIMIQPAPELGAPKWTNSVGKRALLAVYRDEGRATSQAPLNAMEWSCDGTNLIIIAQGVLQNIKLGDLVDLHISNTVLAGAVVSAVGQYENQLAFKVPNLSSYDFEEFDNGEGTWRPVKPINFEEDYVIFRLLPSLKLIKASVARSILEEWTANPITKLETLLVPATGQSIVVQSKPFYTNRSPNGSLTASLHRQQYNEANRPLPQSYDASGRPIPSRLRYNATQNKRYLIEQDRDTLAKLAVFDYYGFALNDSTRLPYQSEHVIVYDSSEPTGIRRQQHQSSAYTGPLFDEFGLPVIGALDSNQLILRDPIMPTQLDQFNIPLKNATPPSTLSSAFLNGAQLQVDGSAPKPKPTFEPALPSEPPLELSSLRFNLVVPDDEEEPIYDAEGSEIYPYAENLRDSGLAYISEADQNLIESYENFSLMTTTSIKFRARMEQRAESVHRFWRLSKFQLAENLSLSEIELYDRSGSLVQQNAVITSAATIDDASLAGLSDSDPDTNVSWNSNLVLDEITSIPAPLQTADEVCVFNSAAFSDNPDAHLGNSPYFPDLPYDQSQSTSIRKINETVSDVLLLGLYHVTRTSGGLDAVTTPNNNSIILDWIPASGGSWAPPELEYHPGNTVPSGGAPWILTTHNVIELGWGGTAYLRAVDSTTGVRLKITYSPAIADDEYLFKCQYVAMSYDVLANVPFAIGYDFGSQPTSIESVRLGAVNEADYPLGFSLEWSDDGETYTAQRVITQSLFEADNDYGGLIETDAIPQQIVLSSNDDIQTGRWYVELSKRAGFAFTYYTYAGVEPAKHAEAAYLFNPEDGVERLYEVRMYDTDTETPGVELYVDEVLVDTGVIDDEGVIGFPVADGLLIGGMYVSEDNGFLEDLYWDGWVGDIEIESDGYVALPLPLV